MQIKYIAFDKRVFDDEDDCRNYERDMLTSELKRQYRKYFYYKRVVLPMRNASYEEVRKASWRSYLNGNVVSRKVARLCKQKRMWETLTLLKRDIMVLQEARKRIKQIRSANVNS